MEAPAAQKRAVEARAARWWRRLRRGLRLPLQIAGTQAAAFGLPFLLYAGLAAAGLDITPVMYVLVVAALLVTVYFIWVEGFLALRSVHPPEEPPADDAARPYPPASAIIAAYLPNEAATIVETVEALLRVDYPGPLQVILAYNTPRDLPVEALLQDIARRDARFLPLRVAGSTSKSQNVNRALAEVTGAFVGVFDADLHPEPDSFTRAWRWLAHGYDVVQGHCVIRNGDDSWVARLVAVEFELIYALSHPGRARLHGFGIFGGANGYWKTDVLRRTRLYGSMLTEDIDASMRLVEQGYRIVSDPLLIARELAPVTLQALWHQRMRWAQGWFQVSLRHLWTGLRSPHMSLRQKLGFVHLLGWREIYAWLAVQMAPILAYWLWQGGPRRVNWLVPLFVLTTGVTLLTGPMQTVLAYLVASPEMRRHRRWFIVYGVLALLFYTGFKNLINRVAQVKEAVGERRWVVTPRSVRTTDARGRQLDP
jgi:cellulose synthase/poly-beta-1,6-N-acetylglucosamine synthase-like glycosyltransferase